MSITGGRSAAAQRGGNWDGMTPLRSPPQNVGLRCEDAGWSLFALPPKAGIRQRIEYVCLCH
jgi:hypothetical protein